MPPSVYNQPAPRLGRCSCPASAHPADQDRQRVSRCRGARTTVRRWPGFRALPVDPISRRRGQVAPLHTDAFWHHCGTGPKSASRSVVAHSAPPPSRQVCRAERPRRSQRPSAFQSLISRSSSSKSTRLRPGGSRTIGNRPARMNRSMVSTEQLRTVAASAILPSRRFGCAEVSGVRAAIPGISTAHPADKLRGFSGDGEIRRQDARRSGGPS